MRKIILALLISVPIIAWGAFNPNDMLGFSPASTAEPKIKFSQSDNADTVAESGNFTIVNFGKNADCLGGGFYLVNLKLKTYQFIDSGTCAADVQAFLSPARSLGTNTGANTILTFAVNGVITARYPLYSY